MRLEGWGKMLRYHKPTPEAYAKLEAPIVLELSLHDAFFGALQAMGKLR